MDIPTALSIIISIAFAITGFVFSNKSDSTLSSIQATINAQQTYFTKLFERLMEQNHEIMVKNHEVMIDLLKMQNNVKLHKGEWTKEDAENFENQLDEAIQQMQRKLYLDRDSFILKQDKVREGEGHG